MMLIKVTVILATVCLSGAVYTRWGHDGCPGGSSLVYSGVAGGSHYTHGGGAVDYICLPKDPEYATGITNTDSAYVYSGEYQFGNVNNKDVPCAVCLESGSQVLMIPAKKSCSSGWSVAYNGILSSGHRSHHSASQYVCLDGELKSVPGTEPDTNGKLFYPVQSSCYSGGLKCPPYKNQVMACVVCVKN